MIALSHISALRYLRSASDFSRVKPSKMPSDLSISRFDKARLTERFAGQDGNVHVLVGEQRQRRRIDGIRCHLTETVPAGGLVRVEGDIFSSSAELCFVQLAQMLPIVQLIKLGFELCGSYALMPDGSFEARPAITSKERLSRFLGHASPMNGTKSARQALAHVVNGSASPRETALAMLLTLPARWGGYGLSKPCLNHQILVPDSRKLSGMRSFYCDLYWPKWNLAVEYDSFSNHGNEAKLVQDQTRAAMLTAQGIRVISVRTQQLNDEERFRHVVDAICSFRSHKRNTPTPSPIAHAELRERVLNSTYDIR